MIDPRPFQAALDQAIAKKRRTKRNWPTPKSSLERNTDLLKKKVIDQQDFDASKYSGRFTPGGGAGGSGCDRERAVRSSITRRSSHRSTDALAFDSSMSATSSTQAIRLASSSSPRCIRFRSCSRLPEQNLQEILNQGGANGGLKVLCP